MKKKRKRIAIFLSTPVCGHDGMDIAMGREECTQVIKGRHADYYVTAIYFGCSKCNAATDRRAKAKVRELENA